MGNSHGFPYFQYAFDPANAAPFNVYANAVAPSESLWSILVTSHPSADPEVAAGILRKAGAVTWSALTTTTVVPHPAPAPSP